MKKNFDKCLEMLLGHEGGFTDDQDDRGNSMGDGHGNRGSTMYGVTSYNYARYTDKPAPPEVMLLLEHEDVAPIYKEKYWDRARCSDLDSGLDWSVFDFYVNAGGNAAKQLQKIVGATRDGAIGPKTLQVVAEHDTKKLIEQMHDARQSYYQSLGQEKYLRGWTNRNKETLKQAMEMYHG